MSSLVTVALVLSIWVSTNVSISSVLIQNQLFYGTLGFLFFFVISVFTLHTEMFLVLLSATCGTCYVPLF